ncbi:hypothetical protein DFS34DRAFT_686696 [Phlyctochytrium arcticum]|nr:hypothetical protein DFS34DRAFT_686696 [Phlyctochytrium arcticum]
MYQLRNEDYRTSRVKVFSSDLSISFVSALAQTAASDKASHPTGQQNISNMTTPSCATDKCVCATYIPWHEQNRGAFQSHEKKVRQEAFESFFRTFRYRLEGWLDSFSALYKMMRQKRQTIDYLPQYLLDPFYEESVDHVLDHHQNPQTISPTVTASGNDVSATDKIVVAQSKIDVRVANSEKALQEHENQIEVMRKNAVKDIEKAALDCKNQKELVRKIVASDITKAVLECKTQIAADNENSLMECRNQMEARQIQAAADHQKALLECRNQMDINQKKLAADHEQALLECKTQIEAMQEKAEDKDKVMETEQSAMVTHVANLEQTLKKCNERIESLEKTLQKSAVNSRDCLSEQVHQEAERGIDKNTQQPVEAVEGPTVIKFQSLFEKEHQHILAAMLQRLTATERQFFGFLQCYDRPISHSHTHMAELQQILNSLPYGVEEFRANAFLRCMQNDLSLYKGWMSETGSVDKHWNLLYGLYRTLRERFRVWWDLNGKDVTNSIGIVINTSLDDRVVKSAEKPNIESHTIDLHQGTPDQNISDAQEMRTETLTRDDGMTDAGSTGQDLKQQVAQLQAFIESTHREAESERDLEQSRHEQLQHMFEELKDEGSKSSQDSHLLATAQNEANVLRLILSDAKGQLEEKDARLKKVFEEKTHLLEEHAANIKVQNQLEAELVLERDRSRTLQTQLDVKTKLLSASQAENASLRQALEDY